MKLEIESAQTVDKGVYKLVAKNEKGEAVSQTVEVDEIPEEEEKKPAGQKPKFAQGLKSVVSFQIISYDYSYRKSDSCKRD